MGRSRRSQLLPIFRSEAQGRVLAAIFLAPDDHPVHVRLIANQTGLPYSTVQREVAVLEASGLVHAEAFATAKVVRAERSSPFYTELASLALKSYGPAAVIGERLANEPAVADAYIFGSWAARYHGEAGADPGDIDVVVVVTPNADIEYLEEELVALGDRLGRDVSVVFTTERDWGASSSAFLRTIRSRPLVSVKEAAGDR